MSDAEQSAIQARKQSNLAFALRSLEPKRRDAMVRFYDFCRRIDDIADEPIYNDTQKTTLLSAWREAVMPQVNLKSEALALLPETDCELATDIRSIAESFDVPTKFLLAIIDGCSMDIGERYYESFEDLKCYCYRVASAVGLVSVRIFGCTHPDTDEFAETLGYALQFTNILRDVVEDYHEMGRVYLPQEELLTFGITNQDLSNPSQNPNCKRLFRLCYYRCKHFFNKARRLMPESERENLKAALIMGAFYEAILERIRSRGFNITAQRTRLSKPEKVLLLLRTLRRNRHPQAKQAKPQQILVWGGGIAGMTAALELGLSGHTPTLLEARSRLGGRAHSLMDARTGLFLDNGQHIAMGCYTAFLKFLDTLGAMDKMEVQPCLEVPYQSPGKQIQLLATADLPEPFHLLMGLIRFGELTPNDRLSILKLGTAIRLGKVPRPSETAADWLARYRQSHGAIRAVWEPFCIAALNEPFATASATLLHETLRRSLFGKAEAARIITAKASFSELFEPEFEAFLKSVGGAVHTGAAVKSLILDNTSKAVSAVVTNNDKHCPADWHISALSWKALAQLDSSTKMPPKWHQLASSPIINIHLLLNQPLFDRSKLAAGFIGLLDSPVHWVFDRTHTLPSEHEGKHLYSIVVSAANDWQELHSSEIQDRLIAELTKFFPPANIANVLHCVVFKWKDATFAATPECHDLRPSTNDAVWPNVALAGDWIQTGLPATLESAAQSGYDAVECLEQRILGSQQASVIPEIMQGRFPQAAGAS